MANTFSVAGSPAEYSDGRRAPSSAPPSSRGGRGYAAPSGASPYLRRQPVRNFLLVRERDRRRVRELRLLAFAVLPAALALLGYTWVQTEIVRGGYRVRGLERRLDELARTERQLRLEASRLESLERVEAAASDVLGMTFPTLEQMVFVQLSPNRLADMASSAAADADGVPSEIEPGEGGAAAIAEVEGDLEAVVSGGARAGAADGALDGHGEESALGERVERVATIDGEVGEGSDP